MSEIDHTKLRYMVVFDSYSRPNLYEFKQDAINAMNKSDVPCEIFAIAITRLKPVYGEVTHHQITDATA